MSNRIALTHKIHLQFDRPVQASTHWLRLRPAPHSLAAIEAYSLKVEAQPHFLNWVRDPYENYLARLDLPESIPSLGLTVDVVASLEPANPFNFLVEPYAFELPFAYPETLAAELAPYLKTGKTGSRLAAWLASVPMEPGYVVERLGELNFSVYEAFPERHDAGHFGTVDLENMLQIRVATPAGLAWLLTLSLRHWGLAARFTSGYLVMLAPPEGGLDFAKLHCWAEVFLPGAGWIGLDPTVGIFTAEGHLPLASAPEPLRTLPVLGHFEACRETRQENVSLRRLQAQAPAWPYSETQWGDIQALGGKVDAALAENDIKLSSSVDLAFVSAYHPNHAEWANASLGTHKRQVAGDLLERLGERLAPGGVLNWGQADWYGGETTPRWRLGCYYRADGVPIWRRRELFGLRQSSFHISPSESKRFAEWLAVELGLDKSLVQPAYEDGLYQLWEHRNLFDYSPASEDLTDPARRRSLADSLSQHQGEPAGFVLPLRWDGATACWASGWWQFRRNGLYLTPGDFPLGYRLPLDSLPTGKAGALEPDPERCQFEERQALTAECGELTARYATVSAGLAKPTADDTVTEPARPPRTAVCVQVRQGQLFVFLPPLTHLEHYLDLVAAVEQAASKTGIPVMLEGYEPPEDYRLLRIITEPEPGILKVSLPEAQDFKAQQDLIASVYAEAQAVGLRAERVLADGKREPPGGRAELRLSGHTPAESPFLRRPDDLRNLIVYWQRHPSLSYFFAGRAIGPSGTAPRPDEGRDDALYELATALHRFPAGESRIPWQSDRLLRHLLADMAGDMKRAEIRIDRLYPPESASKRLGRIQIRSFETPPDAKQASLQTLLVRGILAHLAQTQPTDDVIDWRTALHDRFLLPRLLADDLKAVLQALDSSGFPFQWEWFEPFLNLRFPALGSVQAGEIGLHLRHAHEPWPVLAEETTGLGVARFVDSANARVEVTLTGLSPSRYALVCNDRRAPLQDTGVGGEAVCGIRFKAFNPPSTLHPTQFPVNALVLDVVDLWTGKVVLGCTYYPPRPAVLGPTGPVAQWNPPLEDGQSPEKLLSLPVIMPTWSAGGQFVPKGSGLDRLNPPPLLPDFRYPYLLDLVRMD